MGVKLVKLTVKKLESITSVDIGRKLPDEHSLFGLAKAKADAVPAGTTAKSAMPDVCWAKPACEMAGIDLRTLQRWQASDGLVGSDRRPQALRPVPRYALSEAERAQVLAVANALRFAPVPPARIVPMLADKGVYLASESTFSRILRAQGQTSHRGRAKAPKAVRPPTTHMATAPLQVWCWDMTYLPAQVMGRWFFLYLILDLYSRKIVGWEAYDSDHADHAVPLVRRTALAEGIAALTAKPVLHGDNGSTLKATTVLVILNWLGVKPSCSRPRVSDDNAYAESLFRTAN